MSRVSGSSQRSLSLTEELEKLEQQITLTLQEIDHNFSRAHRIVTSSILPIVDQYTERSREVWEGSKFWKQFFESSANVSLSGYEEQPSAPETVDETITDTTATTHTILDDETYGTPSSEHIDVQHEDEIDLSGLSISPSHSTPRAVGNGKRAKDPTGTFAQQPSPYEALRRELSETVNASNTPVGTADPFTPGKTVSVLQGQGSDVAMTPESSPFLPPTATSLPRPSTSKKRDADPLLHRVLDRNYRVQATPMTTARTRTLNIRPANTSTTPATTRKLFDSMPSSSPDMPAAPELHAEIFSSPMRRAPPSAKMPRTPGVSVLTPAKKVGGASELATGWDSDEDLEDDGEGLPFGHSPPKTVQFHVPQSKLLRTPAQEASKRIVEDLMFSAGGGDLTDDYEIDVDIDENSPSVIRRAENLEDESF